MWPIIAAGLRTYAPYLVFPAAVCVGTIGYLIESQFSDTKRGRLQDPSALEQRSLRKLNENEPSDLESFKATLPKSMLDRNLSNPEAYK